MMPSPSSEANAPPATSRLPTRSEEPRSGEQSRTGESERERERDLRAAAVCTLGFPGLRVPTEGDDRSSSHVPYVDEARRSM